MSTAAETCCGACGLLYDEAEGHRCDLEPEVTGEILVRFEAGSQDDAWNLIAAVQAQLEPCDDYPTACAAVQWTAGVLPAGESAYVSWLLLPVLRDVALLLEAAIKLTTGDVPRWIEYDHDLTHWDKGAMSSHQFRNYYREGAR